MFKTKGKLFSLLTACLTAVLALVLGFAALFAPTPITTANAADPPIAFTLGANGSAEHNDGSSATTYTETANGYTLNITGGTKMYTGARDAKGNSCIKLGTGSAAGGFSFTVPNDVTSVVIAVAMYKLNASKVTVNGTSYTLTKSSNDGAYDEITVDTTSTKTITLTTVSGGYRAMVNSIGFIVPGSGCDHENTTEETTPPTCTEAGSTVVTCNYCGAEVSNTPIEALGHEIENAAPVNNENGTHSITGTCSRCKQEETVTENCDYERAADKPTYTCTLCGYSYTVPEYTVTYVLPAGVSPIDSVKVEENKTITLSTEAETIEGYTFVGWVEETLDEKQETAPDFFEEGFEYTVTKDTTFYALYSYTEGTGAWTKVTDADNLAVGKKIVIVASGSDYALGTTQNNNNRAAVAVTKSGDTVTWTTAVQIITLEAGTVENTFAFNVDNGYLYAASSSSNYLKTQTTNNANGSWKIEITSAGVATIKAQGTYTHNWLRKNTNSALFSCYESGQNDVSIYMKDGATYYVTEFNTCAHEHTKTETNKEATCENKGSENVVCLDCEAILETNEIPELGHDFTSNECPRCGLWNDYSGYYTIAFTQGESLLYANTTNWNDKYSADEDIDTSCVGIEYLFRLTKQVDGSYELTEANGNNKITDTVTLERIVDGENEYFTLKNSEGKYLGLNHSADYDYVKFYTSSYPHNITLTYVALEISSASLSLGESLAMNYYVSTSVNLDEAVMYFDFNEIIYDVQGEKQGDGRYMFTLNEIAPQYMTTNISATLKLGDTELASMAEYSVQAYAQNRLNKSSSDAEKELLTAMLYYGNAAQKHENADITEEELTTYGVENMAYIGDVEIVSSHAMSLVKNEAVETYAAWFTSANVWFSSVNKIRVTLSTAENVTLKINDVEVPVNGTTVYTDGIAATAFGEKVTFKLYHNGDLMQTLEYSIYSYAYSMRNNATMSELVKALYRYGEAAKVYNAQ